jgi:pimeloyl-ACP methyl ester carboxylesterase
MSIGEMQPDVCGDARGLPPQKIRSRRIRRSIVLLLVMILLGIAWNFLRYELRSYALLTRFADPQASGPILKFETYPVTSELVEIPTANGPLAARLYVPVGVTNPRGMVAVHGIHHLGMDEPRLVNFARAMAGSGLAVLTPQIDALADYHVDGASISSIGDSAVWFDARLGRGPVSVTGISFAGGLSLVAAADPRYASHFRSLALMGAYDDLARVSRFLATSQEELPDGTTIPYAAHDYGASVFVYAHLDQFFTLADLPAAHEALRLWLWEQPENARPFLEKLSPASRATMDALLTRRIDVVRPRILEVIQAEDTELAAISPYGHMGSLKIPVFILHGSADNVIPPAESMWLERDLPEPDVRRVLITGAFSHVDPSKNASFREELKLVDFVAAVLRAAD